VTRALALPVSALFCVLLCGAPAQGQVRLAEDWDATFEEATARNIPVLFLLGNDKKAPWTGWFSQPAAAAFLNDRVLVVVAHAGGGHEPEQVVDRKTKQKVERCPRYPQITCQVHADFYTTYGGHFDYEELPAGFLLRPDKSVAMKDMASKGLKQLQKKIDEAQFALGKGVSGRDIQKLQKTLGKGDKKLGKGHFKGARKVYEGAAKDDLHPYLAAIVAERMEKLDAAALEAIEAAKGASERERHETLKRIAREMKGRQPAEAAEQALAEAEGK
jgi:hypothetical protein